MALQFLAIADTPNADGTFNCWPVSTIALDGSLLIDRVLEDVYFTITKNEAGDFAFACLNAEDKNFLDAQCIDMQQLWAKAKTYLEPKEEAFIHFPEKQSTNELDVEIWDDNEPLPDYFVLVEKIFDEGSGTKQETVQISAIVTHTKT